MNRCFRERWLYNKKPRTLHTVRVFVASIDACHSEVVHAIFEDDDMAKVEVSKAESNFLSSLGQDQKMYAPQNPCCVFCLYWFMGTFTLSHNLVNHSMNLI